MSIKEKKEILLQEKINKTTLQEYKNLKEEHSEIEKENKKLKEYLNQNIFNYEKETNENQNIFKLNNIKKSNEINLIKDKFSILEINNLTKFYGSKNIPTLLNISLKVYGGDFHVVVGNFSSGKTTLFNCLQGFEPYDGEIMLNGELNNHDLVKINEICGFLPSTNNWDKFATVEKVIFNKFQEFSLGDDYVKKYIKNSLKEFDLGTIRNKLIIDLNLLEIKKIQLIIALIKNPKLLVFDQPLLGFQHFEKIEFLILLSKLKNSNRSILVFTHNLYELEKYSNTITLLSQGKVYYSGDIQDLLLTNQNKYSISTHDTEATIKILKKQNCKYQLNEIKNLIYVSFDGKLNFLLFQRECANENILIEEIMKIHVNIEDLYPTLLKIGNKTAITEINKLAFFSVN